MRLATPRWWYLRRGAPAPLDPRAAASGSWIWACGDRRRIARGRPIDPGAPVICVGNLTLGGTGKTPVVRALARRLAAQGLAAHILARGYGGRLKGPCGSTRPLHAAADVGDEALMLAETRRSGSRATGRPAPCGRGAAGAEVIVMDDGHQNPAVKKALSLIVVDGETRDGEWPFGDGAVFPAGPMREPLAAGLARADAVVLMLPSDLEAPDPALVALFAGKPVLVARLDASRPATARPAGRASPASASPGRWSGR